ncbi:hypothetical protein ACVU7I_00905 [Patulibacter sp. S7RM1-6]
MSGRLGAAAGAAVLVGLLAIPQVAGARPWTAEYDWQASSRTGYENWVAEESVPGSGQPLPFYRSYLGGAPAQIGRGLAIAPLGGRVYDNGNPSSQIGGPGLIFRWAAPGASRISTARFDDVRYRNAGDGQYLRLRLSGPGGHQDEDLGPDVGESDPATTYSRGPYTWTVPGGGTSAELWMFTVCGRAPQNEPGPYRCPTLASGTPTFGRLGSVRLTLDDPDQPALAVDASPAIDDGWVNKRRTQRLQITAADPSSGIQRIRVQVRAGTSGTGGRTIKTQTVACDPDHTTPGRAGLVCPVTAGTSAVDPAGQQTGSDRTYVVTATDYAGNERSQSFTVRRDVQKPGAATLGGELADIARDWTNLREPINARVRVRDERSGVARVDVLAERQTGGRKILLGATEPDCTGGCRSVTTNVAADLAQLERDGTYRLYVRTTDRAGNTRLSRAAVHGGRLKIDRSKPRSTGSSARYTVRDDGSVRVTFPAAQDRDSGVRMYVFRYFPERQIDDPGEGAAPRFARVRAADAQPTEAPRGRRIRGSRTRALVFTPSDGIDLSAETTLIQLDRARGDRLPNDIAGGEYGNGNLIKASASLDERKEAERIWRAQGLRELEEFANNPANRLPTVERVSPSAFNKSLKLLGKVASRASIISAVVVPLIDATKLGCGQDLRYTHMNPMARTNARLYQRAHAAARDALASRRGFAGAENLIATARLSNDAVLKKARRDVEFYDDSSCGAPAQAAVRPAEIMQKQLIEAHQVLETVGRKLKTRDRLRDCDQAGAKYRSFTNSNKRWNLCVRTKRRPGRAGVPANAEAHHIFPLKWEARFAEAGITNVNDPNLLCWMEKRQHRTGARAYNTAWDDWLVDQAEFHGDNRLHPTDRAAALAHGRALAKKKRYRCRVLF